MADLARVCAVCGYATLRPRAIAVGVVQFADGRSGDAGWTAVPRCQDRDACRGRLLEAGQPWPLIGGYSNIPTSRAAVWRPPIHRVERPEPRPEAVGAAKGAAPAAEPDDPKEWW